MLNIDKKKVFTLFALSSLIMASLLVGVYIPASAQSPDTMNLHGPSLKPIHMHSNITLDPIHMHYTNGILWPDVYPITEPNCTTDWIKIDTELDPIDFEWWHLSSWEDNGDPIGELSQNDQIDMYNWDDESIVEWFHVDRMTLTLLLSGPFQEPTHTPGEVRSIMEMKQPYCNPYDPYVVYDPIGSLWTQVWPVQNRTVNPIMIWLDDPFNPNGMLDVTDSISFDQGLTWWHVEDIATDLILRWKMMDPIGTYWHELYPDYCEWYEMTSWSSFPDPFCDRISSRDTIDMYSFSDLTTHWYFVDRVTVTINVTDGQQNWMMLELKTHFHEEMYHALKKPLGTFWHAVYPEEVYCTVFNLTFWDPLDPAWDNCNGVLDPCDYITLVNQTSGLDSIWHITDMAYDIILNEYITDPVGSTWSELYPEGTFAEYTVSDFEDNNGDLWLSPCDNITLLDPAGFPEEYHVENVTLTLDVEVLDTAGSTPFSPQDIVYLEHIQTKWNYSWPRLYHPKIEPWGTNWAVVNPTTHFGVIYNVNEWFDNCNGVVDDTDTIYFVNADGALIVRVNEIAVDIVVDKGGETPPPPPPWYKKPSYADYAPFGMPDFDQKQQGWSTMNGWTHCGPVAVANSLMWFDSKYEVNTIGPPAIIDTFPMVTSYNPGVWDDHDPQNVVPLVNDLAFLMDTDGIRTFLPHTGTNYIDMQTGISQYLQQQGINPVGDCDGDGDVDNDDINIIIAAFLTVPGVPGWDMRADLNQDNIVDINDQVLAIANLGQVGMFYEHTEDYPDFYFIEEEVERCQDVVLLLTFWMEIEPELWIEIDYPFDLPSGGHYVTVAGVNSSTGELLLSDPWWDAAEAGWWGDVPNPHPAHLGNPTVHNDAQFVSHDAYGVFPWPSPPPTSPYPFVPLVWELAGYLQQLGYPPNFHAFIRAAVITSPLEGPDVAVINVTTSKTGCLPMETVGKGTNVTVYATVENQGSSIETFNTTVTANANVTIIIGEQQVTLNPGQNQTLTFVWVTTGVTYGNYTIEAIADTVPGETDIADNTFTDGTVLITITGDLDGNRLVNIFDIVRITGRYMMTYPHPNWDPNADIIENGKIDIFDVVAAAGNYMKSW